MSETEGTTPALSSASPTPLVQCPPWCRFERGHGWDSIDHKGVQSAIHGGPTFGLVSCGAEEREDNPGFLDFDRGMCVAPESWDLDITGLALLKMDVEKALEWVKEHRGAPWWRTVPNPPCWDGCTTEHTIGEFNARGVLVCAHVIGNDSFDGGDDWTWDVEVQGTTMEAGEPGTYLHEVGTIYAEGFQGGAEIDEARKMAEALVAAVAYADQHPGFNGVAEVQA
ncbi:hypothetical protein [Nocardioides bruguierae]|uniref:Uncharacterized protein n=1 Tax=Nocardioides bruguierae TaxID=2945102 RepID=A0A9X2IDX9_9ACTN|nr:hypothetical protein [Nocardioides bruguierae]MCM0618759.1 hypothetical protein [Nocardioides bruguierae]